MRVTTQRLDKLAETIKGISKDEDITLVGHTDHLRGGGHQELNRLLSEQRAKRVKQYLIGKGIAANRIHTRGAGSTQPLVQCSTKVSMAKQIVCLRPNRRVEIILGGVKH